MALLYTQSLSRGAKQQDNDPEHTDKANSAMIFYRPSESHALNKADRVSVLEKNQREGKRHELEMAGLKKEQRGGGC